MTSRDCLLFCRLSVSSVDCAAAFKLHKISPVSCWYSWITRILNQWISLCPLVSCLFQQRRRIHTTSTWHCCWISSGHEAVMVVRLSGCISWHSKETQSHWKLHDPLFFTVFLTLLPQCFLYLSVLYMYPLELGPSSLHFNWLLYYLMVSVYCKEKSPSEERMWRPQLLVDIKTNS